MKSAMKLKRAISVDQIERKRFKTLTFTGAWALALGEEVDANGSWILWGESGNGKTTAALALSKYLTKFGRVAYNTLEEGARFSFQKAIERARFNAKQKEKFIILSETVVEISERLKRQKSPDFIIMDSLQYSFIDRQKYAKLISDNPTKLFIWISHAQGKQPLGRFAGDVKYHCDVKMRAEGFKLIIESRFGGSGEYVVNADKAAIYWNQIM